MFYTGIHRWEFSRFRYGLKGIRIVTIDVHRMSDFCDPELTNRFLVTPFTLLRPGCAYVNDGTHHQVCISAPAMEYDHITRYTTPPEFNQIVQFVLIVNRFICNHQRFLVE